MCRAGDAAGEDEAQATLVARGAAAMPLRRGEGKLQLVSGGLLLPSPLEIEVEDEDEDADGEVDLGEKDLLLRLSWSSCRVAAQLRERRGFLVERSLACSVQDSPSAFCISTLGPVCPFIAVDSVLAALENSLLVELYKELRLSLQFEQLLNSHDQLSSKPLIVFLLRN